MIKRKRPQSKCINPPDSGLRSLGLGLGTLACRTEVMGIRRRGNHRSLGGESIKEPRTHTWGHNKQKKCKGGNASKEDGEGVGEVGRSHRGYLST